MKHYIPELTVEAVFETLQKEVREHALKNSAVYKDLTERIAVVIETALARQKAA